MVKFDADRNRADQRHQGRVRYLNLVGDRYLELVDAPGSTRCCRRARRFLDRTEPALDLDLLLGGLKPVIQGLNPQDVNALTASLIQVFQGQGGTLESLLRKTSSFSNTLADNNQTVQQLIDNLSTVVATLAKDGDQFSDAIDKLEKLISGFSQDRDPIGTAITSLDNGTASLADLLTQARPPLNGTIDQLNRLAPCSTRTICSTQRCSGRRRTTASCPARVLRQLHPVLHLWAPSGHRPAGPDGRSGLPHQTTGGVLSREPYA